VQITINGKKKSLGLFEDSNQAKDVYLKAKLKYHKVC